MPLGAEDLAAIEIALDPILMNPTDTLTLHHPDGLTVTLSAWGASWLSCVVPMAGGAAREVLLPPRHARIGADQPRTFMGATLGRYAKPHCRRPDRA